MVKIEKIRLDSYRCLIANLPVLRHASTSKKETWQNQLQNQVPNFPEQLAHLFGENDTATISRADLFWMAGATAIQQFVYGVILWGYPKGMRSDYFPNLVKSMPQIVNMIGNIRNAGNRIPNWNQHWNDHFRHAVEQARIRGLGLSTYSKILYFMNTRANGKRCLIIDRVLINVFKAQRFDEFQPLREITYENAPTRYLEYLSLMEMESSRLGVTAYQLEMFLFMFGPVLK